MESGKLYKIVSISTDKVYIGSTVKTLDERLDRHETDYEKWFNSGFCKHYCSSFEILKYGNYQIELLEEYLYSNYSELLKREGYYQLNNNCVNTVIAGGRKGINKINSDLFYKCYCGREMQNKYRTRFNHTKSFLHKFLVQDSHTDLIKVNHKFEVTII